MAHAKKTVTVTAKLKVTPGAHGGISKLHSAKNSKLTVGEVAKLTGKKAATVRKEIAAQLPHPKKAPAKKKPAKKSKRK